MGNSEIKTEYYQEKEMENREITRKHYKLGAKNNEKGFYGRKDLSTLENMNWNIPTLSTKEFCRWHPKEKDQHV